MLITLKPCMRRECIGVTLKRRYYRDEWIREVQRRGAEEARVRASKKLGSEQPLNEPFKCLYVQGHGSVYQEMKGDGCGHIVRIVYYKD